MRLKRNFVKQIIISLLFVIIAVILWNYIEPLLGVLVLLMAFWNAGVALLAYFIGGQSRPVTFL